MLKNSNQYLSTDLTIEHKFRSIVFHTLESDIITSQAKNALNEPFIKKLSQLSSVRTDGISKSKIITGIGSLTLIIAYLLVGISLL